MPTSNGDIYVLRDDINVEINSAKIINPFGMDTVQGCVPMRHDLNTLVNLWIPKQQMLQVAPGHRWCSACGDARPDSYFDVMERNADGTPKAYSKECRQCINNRDPKLAKEKYCSSCKLMHPRNEFADDTRYQDGKFPSCVNGKRRGSSADYARDKWLNEGIAPGSWGGHRERKAGEDVKSA